MSTFVGVADNDKIDLADKISPIIVKHEGVFLGPAFADASCQYGQWRQRGLSHAEALVKIQATLQAWYADTFAYTPPPLVLSTLRVDGGRFLTSDDREWIWRGASDFSLYQRFRRGEDVVPIIAQRKAAGANLVRVFCRAAWINARDPYDYESLLACRDLLLDQGLYSEWVALADCQTLGQSPQEQRRHVALLAEALTSRPTFIELVNEFPHGGTRVDPAAFSYPGGDGLVWSVGSSVADGVPFSPPWDYVTHHPARNREWVPHGTDVYWQQVLGYGNLPMRPIVADEIIRATSQARDPAAYRTFAQVWRAAGGAGVTFHSDAGLDSTLWPEDQQACAQACFEGLGT